MARVWIVVRDGFRLLGTVKGDVSLEVAITRLDLAPWRLFSKEPPELVSPGRVENGGEHRRVLVEVFEDERPDFSAYEGGCFYESPFSPQECLRRLELPG